MDNDIRKVVRIDELPEPLRAGFDPTRPVEIVQQRTSEPSRRVRLREQIDRLTFRRLATSEEAVRRVRAIRDGERF